MPHARRPKRPAGSGRASWKSPFRPRNVAKRSRGQLTRRYQQEATAAREKIQKMSKILLEAAERRFALQTRILETALLWDDPAHLWKEIEPQATANDTDQKEPYFNTPIPWQLAVDLRRAGHKEERRQNQSGRRQQCPARRRRA